MMDLNTDPMAGKILDGKYEILAFIGMGGMSKVYRARHMDLNRVVAIKFLKSAEAIDLQRFRREAISISQLEHTNIARIYGFSITPEGEPHMALEYLEGKDLSGLFMEKPLPVERIVNIARQIAAGMDHAHSRGVIHRDLKPSNVMLVSESGNPDSVKIVDFGTARLLSAAAQSLTQEGELFGTRGYISPELYRGAQADARSDIYSLGKLIWDLAIHDGKLSSELQAIIEKSMDANPDKRYQSMRELMDALDEVSPEAPQVASPIEGAEKQFHLPLLGLIAFTGVLIFVLGAFTLLKKPEPAVVMSKPSKSVIIPKAGSSLYAICDSYLLTGDRDTSIKLVEAWMSRYGERATHADLCEVYCVLGRAYGYGNTKNLERSIHYWKEMLKHAAYVPEFDRSRVTQAMCSVSTHLNDTGKPEEGLPVARENYDYCLKTFGVESSQYSDALVVLGICNDGLNNGDEARKLYEQAVSHNIKYFGERGNETTGKYHALARHHYRFKRYREALLCLSKSLPLADAKYKAAPDTVAQHTLHANILKATGRLDEAEDELNEVLKIHPSCQLVQERLDSARALLEQIKASKAKADASH